MAGEGAGSPIRDRRLGAARSLAAGLLLVVPVLSGCAVSEDAGTRVPYSPLGYAQVTRWSLAPSARLRPGDREIPLVLHESGCRRRFAGSDVTPVIGYGPTSIVVEVYVGYEDTAVCGYTRRVPYTVRLREPLGERRLFDGCLPLRRPAHGDCMG